MKNKQAEIKQIEKITKLVQKQANCFAKSEVVEQQKRHIRFMCPLKNHSLILR
ncbi:hypothetical protein [Proteus alimentorum]|uniref:hypothetical protein n=1 Tax=Proteus alimentorum TaxID=1973495 RepID=UPI0013EA6914|nr:hypothetical protein [Proteus alimentorum]